jgi:hypothetical protein
MNELKIEYKDGKQMRVDIQVNNKLGKWIICSHGFGVDLYSYKLFSDIANTLLDYNFMMFDYNDFFDNGDQLLHGIEDIVSRIESSYEYIKANYEVNEVNLIGHSAGNLYFAQSSLVNVMFNKIVMLAPVIKNPYFRMIERFESRHNSTFDLKGISTLVRRNGAKVMVHFEYLKYMELVEPLNVYQRLKNFNKGYVIVAENDEIIKDSGPEDIVIPNFSVEVVPGDHNFRGEYRAGILSRLKELF